MNNRVVVLGAGQTKFEKETDKKMDDMAIEAAMLALDDAGMNYSDIEMGFVGNVYQPGIAFLLYYGLGKTGIPITRVDIACASSSRCIQLGAYLVEAGAYETIMIVGVEIMPKGMVPMPLDPAIISIDSEFMFDAVTGLMTMPGAYAHKAIRYMHEYDAKPEQFASVAVKNHKNASLNPKAMYKKELTLEEVMQSRMVSTPLTLYQCCSNSSGAAAIILTTEKKARKFTTKPVYLAGWAEASISYTKDDPVKTSLSEGNTEMAAAKAYRKAGIEPSSVNFAQVHDAFSFGEIFQIEELGLCPKGEGASYAWQSKTDINGSIPVNTDGGLLGCGHPIGATGSRMVAETCLQLKGLAGTRQVSKAKVGLIQNSGLGATNVLVFQT